MWIRAALVVCWVGAAATGLVWLMGYDTTPGVAANAPSAWPSDSQIPRDPSRPVLVMLAHPQCDCTKASIAELAELMARTTDRPRAFVVFIKPRSVGDDWNDTALRRAADAIPGVTTIRDDVGRAAARFGAATSGQVFLYDSASGGGRLLFSGGTTSARGKSGDNVGRASLLALLNGTRPERATTPVFGCSLFGPGDRPSASGAHAHES
jgi:hypothetical protein